MGSVWAAQDLKTGSRVALKFLSDDSSSEQQQGRLRRELRAACAVEHPNVVRIHRVIEREDGAPVMVMEHLEGESLADRLDRVGSMPLTEIAAIMQQVVSAVGQAHACGVIHRDLKPENIFLCEDRRRGCEVKILDFGIAKVATSSPCSLGPTWPKEPGALLGTPCYMPPEQLMGDIDLDHRADVWAIGLVLYEALSGTLPTDGDNLAQTIKLVAIRPIAPLHEVVPDLPADVVELVRRMLSRNRDDRPRDLREAQAVLATYADAVTPSFGPPAPTGPRPSTGRAASSEPAPGSGAREPDSTPPEPSAPTRRSSQLPIDPLSPASLVDPHRRRFNDRTGRTALLLVAALAAVMALAPAGPGGHVDEAPVPTASGGEGRAAAAGGPIAADRAAPSRVICIAGSTGIARRAWQGHSR